MSIKLIAFVEKNSISTFGFRHFFQRVFVRLVDVVFRHAKQLNPFAGKRLGRKIGGRRRKIVVVRVNYSNIVTIHIRNYLSSNNCSLDTML